MRRFSRGGNAQAKRASTAGLALLLGWLGATALCFSPAHATSGGPTKATAGARPAPSGSTRALQPSGAAKWLRVPAPTVEASESGRAGSLRVVEGGMRIELSADGSMAQSSELLPPGARHLELPSWLGGGFLFWSHVERATWLWRSDRFTSPLQPLAQVSTIVQRVVPGFDRLFLWSGANQALRAIDVRSGQVLDAGALPASSAYGPMAFASPWFGAVLSDISGLQVTVDSGMTWQPLGIDGMEFQLQPTQGSIELRSNHDRYLLDSRGTVTALTTQGLEPLSESDPSDDGEAIDTETSAAALLSHHPGRRGASALAAALQHGFKVAADSAIVVTNGALARVRLSDGRLERQRSLGLTHPAHCQALRLASGHGFLCVDTTGTTQLYRYQPSFALSPLASFSTPRTVLASGTGGLVIGGSCNADAAFAARDRYCLYDGHTWRDLQHQSAKRERVVLTAQGAVVAVQPPDLKHSGSLRTIHGSSGKDSQQPLKLPALPPRVRSLLAVGHWLDPLSEGPHGELATWVVGDQQFVGVRVKRDGAVEVSALRSDLPSTRFNGSIALTLTSGGVAHETSNFGFDWHTIGLPASVTLPDPYKPSPATANDWGCTEIGCVFGSWLRIGTGPGSPPAQASEPPRATVAKSGMPHWSMQCRATGERREPKRIAGVASEEAAPAGRPSRASGPTPFDALESGSWRAFLGEAPPVRNSQHLGVDIGNDEYRAQFRVYAWGPRSSDWASLARWQMRIANRFAVDSVWSTSIARAPWATPILAAQAFGQGDQSSEFVDWSVTLDAPGDAGLVRLLTRAGSQLFLAEKGRPTQPLQHGSQLDLQKPMSLTRLFGRRYIAGENEGSFVVFQVEADQLKAVGRYPVLAPDSTRIQLVSSRASDALAIWVKTPDRGWFLFPLDLETGAALPALRVPVEQLNGVPRTCTAEDQGWQLISDTPLATLAGSPVNVRLSLSPTLDHAKVHDVEARVLVTQAGLCLEALAGQLDDSDGAMKQSSAQAAGSGTPVATTLTDRATGRRFGFRCSR